MKLTDESIKKNLLMHIDNVTEDFRKERRKLINRGVRTLILFCMPLLSRICALIRSINYMRCVYMRVNTCKCTNIAYCRRRRRSCQTTRRT